MKNLLAHSPNTLKEAKFDKIKKFKILILYLGYNDLAKQPSHATVPLKGQSALLKKKSNFSSFKEIQKGSGAKSSMRKSFLIYEKMGKYLVAAHSFKVVFSKFKTNVKIG